MNIQDILCHVDHTALKAVTTWEQVRIVCQEALKYNTASVCIPPSYVKRVKENYPSLVICTVIGFPLGYQTTEVKIFEAKNALENGADEIDMVINLGDMKNGDFEKITKEISEIKKLCCNKILKVIVEACYLSENEKIESCRCVSNGGADYIKTSTGFGSGGALVADVELFKKYICKDIKIKAAGGIKTTEDCISFLELGCERIGASSIASSVK